MFQALLDQALANIARGHEEELRRVTEALCTENASLTRQLARMQMLLSSTSQLPSADAPAKPAPLELPIPEPPRPPFEVAAENRSPGSSAANDQRNAGDQNSPGELQGSPTGQGMSALFKPHENQAFDLPGAVDQGSRPALPALPEEYRVETEPASTAPVVKRASSVQFLEEPDSPHTQRQSKRVSLMTHVPSDGAHDSVEVQPVWQQDRAPDKRATSSRRLSPGSLGLGMQTRRSSVPEFTLVNVVTEKNEKRRCWSCLNSLVMFPGSNKRLAFEVFGLLLILYDLVWWPAQVFGFASVPFTRAILWLSSAFWAFDLLLSFFVGFTIIDQGLIEMRVSKIAWHYARTWLPMDLSLVLLDWTLNTLILLSHYGVADFGGGAFLEKAKVLRLLRLLRLFKASGFISALSDRIQSETRRILVRVLKLLVFIISIVHLIACSWYGIGINDVEREDTWVKANDLNEKGAVYAYTTALHWSITQFVPASMEVVPKNELERSFSIVVIVSAMVIFSSFISTITNAMNQLRNLNSERNAELIKLRRFFSENNVSTSLVARISSCIHQSTKLTSSRVHSEDISILDLLPVSLKCDLAEEVYAPTLCAHPLIFTWAEYYPRESKRLFVAARSFSLGTKHELFHAGQVPENVYFLSSGQMVFIRDDQANEPPAIVSPGQWLTEPAMWIKWKHVGHSSSTENCELVVLPCDAAARILSQSNPSTDSGPRRYARTFAAYFAKQPDRLSDVWADMDVIDAMVSTAFIKEERELLRQEAASTGIKHMTPFAMWKKRTTSGNLAPEAVLERQLRKNRSVSGNLAQDANLERHHKTLTALQERVVKYSADTQQRKDILGIGSSDSSGSSDDSVPPAISTISRPLDMASPKSLSPVFAINPLNVVPGIASAFRHLT
ncbi:unnamed protein product, partial [Polarella glacialis]